MSAARRRRKPKGKEQSAPGMQDSPSTSRGVLYLPLALTGLLGALSFMSRVQANPRLTWSFWGAIAALVVCQGVLWLRLNRADEGRSLTKVLRPQHYIQAMVQVAVFGYWGWYWRPVYAFVGLIIAQLAFAYAVDMLIQWWRRDRYVLGFGPFPIILSINLFIWFRDDWFYLQFLMIGIGFLGKEFVRWQRDGRRVHIFNPSAFALGLFSLVLIATGTTDLTFGPDIASTLTLAPYMYTLLFVVGLVVMYFFSITLVAGSAAAVLFGGSALYSAWAGVPYFIDSDIPAAVFLGLHLLITDPSTSPRTPPGKMLFGVLYGSGAFYDKLLCVPLLNLSVRGIDGLIHRIKASPAWSSLRAGWVFTRSNLAHMAVWVVLFGAMSALGRTDGTHPGDRLPFWVEACDEGRRNACDRLLQLEATYCGDASAWACNELGVAYAEGQIIESDGELASGYFSRACELRLQAACLNLLGPGGVTRAEPRVLDLRLLLREGGGNLMDAPEPEIYERACEHGWGFACERAASL
jgi:hypothetical protein